MATTTILQYLASNEDRFIEELFDYTRIPSISAQSDHADGRAALARTGRGVLRRWREPRFLQ